MITIGDLKLQRRWILWRLEPGKDDKMTKVPYQPNGYKADITNPAQLHTYAELEPLAPKFSGIGLALGEFDGVSVWGLDFDKCCDAVTGKFSPESRQVVIDLDTYGEYSPSGTGAHVLGIGKLPIEPGNKRSVLIRPYPGCKQVDKWERDDYREMTITKAILAVMKDAPVLLGSDDADTMEDDGETEFLIENADCNPNHDGWFPVGEVSLIGAASGVGKTSWAMPLFEKVRKAEEVWGHKVLKARDYRVLLHDRSKKGMRRTTRSMHMSPEAMERVIRLTPEQQKRQPAEIMQAVIEATPGVEVWIIEGLDMWIPDMNKMEKVAPVIDSLQRIATRYNVAIVATVGAPKQKGKDRYFGRDALFGSSALARKVETVVLMGLHDEEDPNSVRRCWILPRAGRAERMYFTWGDDGQLVQTGEPEPKEKEDNSAYARVTAAVQATFTQGQPVVWTAVLGAESTFYRWRKWAVTRKIAFMSEGKLYLSPSGVKMASA